MDIRRDYYLKHYRLALKLYGQKMKLKYGEGWRGKYLLSEKAHEESLARALDLKSQTVYRLYQ